MDTEKTYIQKFRHVERHGKGNIHGCILPSLITIVNLQYSPLRLNVLNKTIFLFFKAILTQISLIKNELA